jgi:hypothetical protein
MVIGSDQTSSYSLSRLTAIAYASTTVATHSGVYKNRAGSSRIRAAPDLRTGARVAWLHLGQHRFSRNKDARVWCAALGSLPPPVAAGYMVPAHITLLSMAARPMRPEECSPAEGFTRRNGCGSSRLVMPAMAAALPSKPLQR